VIVYKTPYQTGLKPREIINGTYSGATITSIAVSSKNIPIKIYDSCIIIKTPQGLKFHLSINKFSIALTAPIPSKTAPKQRAASMIHINIHDTPKVFFKTSSMVFLFNLPLAKAAMVAAKAPTAEHSTKLAIPIINKPVITKKITKGIIPALNNFNFSINEICLSSFESTGPNSG